jgi:hypothetical protein
MKTIYIDLDNVVVDFTSAFSKIEEKYLLDYKENLDDIPHIFSLMEPLPKAIESVEFLAEYFKIYFLSTAPWNNPTAWSDKVRWIKQYFPEIGYKKLILSHHKNLLQGNYLIDDRLANGASKFKGEHIHFGSEKLKNWSSVLLHLCKKENISIPHQLIYRKKQELVSLTFRKDLKNYIYLLQQKLHLELFPEEYDFIYDSLQDSNDRKNNKNPMSNKYIDETNLRRKTMGVSELGKNGEPKDTSSKDYCKEMIKKKLKNIL